MDDLPPRILRFRLRLLRFKYNIVHVPGKALITADTLSRAPRRCPLTAEEAQLERKVYVNLSASQSKHQQIAERQQQDAVCSQLILQCKRGWPWQEELSQKLKPYWVHQSELLMNSDLWMSNVLLYQRHCKMKCLPDYMRDIMGITKCRLRAQQSVWWLGPSAQITKILALCEICAKYQHLHPEPMIPSELPKRQRVWADMFYWENDSCLLVEDYYSLYIEMLLI